MPSRIIPFVNGQFYHVYNRGSEKRQIFDTKKDFQHFIKAIKYYQLEGPKPKFSRFSSISLFKPELSKKIVDIIAYCLMPNHFHFLVRQTKDGGITEFISKLTNSYTRFYNTKYNRIGPLFQGEFKAVLVEYDEQLLHLSRYIHLNPLVAYLIKDLTDYEWSSYNEYVNNKKEGICSKQEILAFFNSPKEYKQFISDQADYALQTALYKHKLIDE